MYYMSSPFYHSFVMLNHTFSYHLHTMSIIHGIFIYHASLYSCRDCDAGEEESEPVFVGDHTSVETQGTHLSISYTLFWINEVYVSCLRMSYYIYIYISLIA